LIITDIIRISSKGAPFQRRAVQSRRVLPRQAKRDARWERLCQKGWVFPEGRGVPALTATLWFVSVGTEMNKRRQSRLLCVRASFVSLPSVRKGHRNYKKPFQPEQLLIFYKFGNVLYTAIERQTQLVESLGFYILVCL